MTDHDEDPRADMPPTHCPNCDTQPCTDENERCPLGGWCQCCDDCREACAELNATEGMLG